MTEQATAQLGEANHTISALRSDLARETVRADSLADRLKEMTLRHENAQQVASSLRSDITRETARADMAKAALLDGIGALGAAEERANKAEDYGLEQIAILSERLAALEALRTAVEDALERGDDTVDCWDFIRDAFDALPPPGSGPLVDRCTGCGAAPCQALWSDSKKCCPDCSHGAGPSAMTENLRPDPGALRDARGLPVPVTSRMKTSVDLPKGAPPPGPHGDLPECLEHPANKMAREAMRAEGAKGAPAVFVDDGVICPTCKESVPPGSLVPCKCKREEKGAPVEETISVSRRSHDSALDRIRFLESQLNDVSRHRNALIESYAAEERKSAAEFERGRRDGFEAGQLATWTHLNANGVVTLKVLCLTPYEPTSAKEGTKT